MTVPPLDRRQRLLVLALVLLPLVLLAAWLGSKGFFSAP